MCECERDRQAGSPPLHLSRAHTNSITLHLPRSFPSPSLIRGVEWQGSGVAETQQARLYHHVPVCGLRAGRPFHRNDQDHQKTATKTRRKTTAKVITKYNRSLSGAMELINELSWMGGRWAGTLFSVSNCSVKMQRKYAC